MSAFLFLSFVVPSLSLPVWHSGTIIAKGGGAHVA
nr:MAG TPA_asm: hypothetical protein [Caudoviricetes sp.]